MHNTGKSIKVGVSCIKEKETIVYNSEEYTTAIGLH